MDKEGTHDAARLPHSSPSDRRDDDGGGDDDGDDDELDEFE